MTAPIRQPNVSWTDREGEGAIVPGGVIYHWRHGWIPLDHAAALKKAHGSHSSAAKLLGKSPATRKTTLTREQYEALRPASSWSAEKREHIVKTLSTTPEGKILADTLSTFQDGGSIARLRTKLNQHLAGEKVDNTSRARAEALLGAIRDAPSDWAPDKLYRGMTVSGTPENVLKKYQSTDRLDLPITSFSSDRAVGKKFHMLTSRSSGRSTRVMVELIGPDKKLIPIQNLPKDRRLFAEKEWVTAGHFQVVEAKKSPDGGVILRVRQVGTP